MRKAHIAPLTATVKPGSALLRVIAGKPGGRAPRERGPSGGDRVGQE
jgi:hypothetical protein